MTDRIRRKGMFNAKNGCRLLFTLLMGVSLVLGASDPELLKPQDVSKVMQQIFEQHVDKKEISTSIISKSFVVYLDQFDPDRMYLLDQEANPYMHLSDAAVTKIMDQYKHNQFPEYTDLNNIIQKSISRARELRATIEKNESAALFKKAETVTSNGLEEWRDPDLKKPFPKNESELKDHIRNEIVHFIASEYKRYGKDFIEKREVQMMRLIEKEARDHENQYLYLTESGQPMAPVDQQNAFAMHILKSLSNSLDAHTTILNPAEANDMRVRLEKEVQGVGIAIQPNKDGGYTISQLIEGGPAAKSGLIHVKDQLIEIDGKPVADKSFDEVMEQISGKVGTKAIVVVSRSVIENGKPVDKTIRADLVREEIFINDDRAEVSSEVFGDGIIGKIKLDSFYQSENGVSSENDLRDGIKKLDKQGNLRGLILDLRENSGGFLSQAVKVAGLFISNGVVVVSKYFNGEENFYRDMEGKRAYDGPLIILTSKATASAAEIVAQALQDYGVAIIVGDVHTYGKGSIQSQTVTENKGSTYFKVTVGKYYTVSGKTPQIEGVKADVVVPSQFVHENIGEEYLDYPLQEDTIPASYDDKLADVAPNLKAWYMHYYVPTLQHKKELWIGMLPTLQKNSAYRIANNKDYQKFIKGSNPEEIVAAWNRSQGVPGTDDLQMAEAINIMKDMIGLHADARGNNGWEQTASLPSEHSAIKAVGK